MRTKIFLIFVLFAISLFGQVSMIDENTLCIEVAEENNKNLHCIIILIETGTWAIYFRELNEPIHLIETDNFKYYFKSIEIDKDDNGFWASTTASLVNDSQKKLFKDIINSKHIIVSTENKSYSFNFNKYKRELENNAFYKKTMQ